MSDVGRAAEVGRVQVATFEEIPPRTAYALMALRSAVFVVEQDCVYNDLDGRDLHPRARHLWLEDEEGPVAYLRLFESVEDDGASRIGRVVTDPRARGRGHAATLVRAALDLVGPGDVVLDAQSHLGHWYERLGFVRDGEDFLEDGIPHTPMRLRRPG